MKNFRTPCRDVIWDSLLLLLLLQLLLLLLLPLILLLFLLFLLLLLLPMILLLLLLPMILLLLLLFLLLLFLIFLLPLFLILLLLLLLIILPTDCDAGPERVPLLFISRCSLYIILVVSSIHAGQPRRSFFFHIFISPTVLSSLGLGVLARSSCSGQTSCKLSR